MDTRTPEPLRARVREYYRATTESSYLASWAKSSLGFHFGLADEATTSLAEAHDNVNAFLADKAGVGPGTRVLDAGCGVGGSSLWLARHKRAQVVGITLLEEQVALARHFAQERRLHSLTSFLCRDMMQTGLRPRSFDVVWNIESACYAFDARAYASHVWSLLRPGGRFVAVELLRGTSQETAFERDACDGWAMPALRTRETMEAVLADVGFDAVESLDLTAQSMLPARALSAMAHNAMLLVRAEKALLGLERPIYERHVRAAARYVEGLEAGALQIGYFGGIRPEES